MELGSVAEKLFACAHTIPGMRGVLEFRSGEASIVSVTVPSLVIVCAGAIWLPTLSLAVLAVSIVAGHACLMIFSLPALAGQAWTTDLT